MAEAAEEPADAAPLGAPKADPPVKGGIASAASGLGALRRLESALSSSHAVARPKRARFRAAGRPPPPSA